MKVIGNLVILFFFELILVIGENSDDINTFNGHEWFLSINVYNNECSITPVKPKIFLGSYNCLYNIVNNNNVNVSKFLINWKSAFGSQWSRIVIADKSNFTFNGEITQNFGNNRQIAMIISNQPCVPFSVKSIITESATELYFKYPKYFNKRRQIVHLNNDTKDIDFTHCSIPILTTNYSIQLDPCNLSEDKNYLHCSYNETQFTPTNILQKLGFDLFCNSIKNPERKFLAGLVTSNFTSEKNREKISKVTAINVSDMWKFIDKKWKELYPTAPEEYVEFARLS